MAPVSRLSGRSNAELNPSSIIDPFGSGLGIMYNFQYVQVLNAQAT